MNSISPHSPPTYLALQTQIISIRIQAIKILFIRFYCRWHVVSQIRGTEAPKGVAQWGVLCSTLGGPQFAHSFSTCLTTALLIGIYSTQGLGVQWVMRRVRPSAPSHLLSTNNQLHFQPPHSFAIRQYFSPSNCVLYLPNRERCIPRREPNFEGFCKSTEPQGII